jgi:hypothetical protein
MNTLSNEELLLKDLTHSLLYEGYALYPTRRKLMSGAPAPFGVLYPEAWCEENIFMYSKMQTSCIFTGAARSWLSIRIGFLQVEKGGEAIEREICPRDTMVEKLVQSRAVCYFVSRPASPAGLRGRVIMQAFPVAGPVDAFRIMVLIENCSLVDEPRLLSPEAALKLAFVSTHTILRAEEGEFISCQEPATGWAEAVKTCINRHTWPVLIGEENRVMLSSSIILHDHPRVSAMRGDIFESAHPPGKEGHSPR